MKAQAEGRTEEGALPKSDVFTDLALTMPIFVAYHLGVALLPVRNAADPVTAELRALAAHSLPVYAALTLAIGLAFAGLLWVLGKKEELSPKRFAMIAVEGTLYAILMRIAGAYVVGQMRLAPPGASGPFAGLVMSLGAGFYEEIAFRVALFGGGAFLIKRGVPSGTKRLALTAAWAVLAACVFSGWHYVGAMGDPFDLQSFVFRAVCGLVLTLIFVLRGFAPAVWTHALYDVWVLVF